MEDDREFIKNIDTVDGKERLNYEERKSEEFKNASINQRQNYMNMESSENNSEFLNRPFVSYSQGDNIEDLILDTPKDNNKKKYIMLGFGLVLLFIITVLIIRLISNSDTQNQFEEVDSVKSELSKEGIFNKIHLSEEYQQQIDKENTLDEAIVNIEKQKQEVYNIPLVLDTPKVKIEESVKKVMKTATKILAAPKRKIALAAPETSDFATKTDVLKGYFIQIGAFSQEPNKNLLDSIGTMGYTYKIHQVTINRKIYNKVLIGSFESSAEARKKLGQVKLDFRNPNAYILKF